MQLPLIHCYRTFGWLALNSKFFKDFLRAAKFKAISRPALNSKPAWEPGV